MPASEMRLIKRCVEYRPKSECDYLEKGIRGIYVLYKKRRTTKSGKEVFDVKYVGMTKGGSGGVRARLRSHAKSLKKGSLWDHFSVFEVFENIKDSEIEELEGLFRHLFKRDSNANALNAQRGYRPLGRVRKATADSLFLE